MRFTDFAGVRGLAAEAGIAYMVLIARRTLPERHPSEELANSQSQGRSAAGIELVAFYELKERLHEITILPQSRLSGLALENTGIGSQLSLTAMAISLNSYVLLSPSQNEVLHSGDVLLITGRDKMVEHLAAWGTQVQPAGQWSQMPVSASMEMLEILPAPYSTILGKSIKERNYSAIGGRSRKKGVRGGRTLPTHAFFSGISSLPE